MSLRIYGTTVLCAAAFLALVAIAPLSASAATTTSSSTSQTALLAQIEALMKLIAELKQKLSVAQGDLQDAIKAGLEEGMQDDDIKKVQELLATDSEIYPEGRVTGFYGPMTRAAIKRLQERYQIEGTGQLDEKTRNLIKELRKERQHGNLPPGLLKSQEVRQRVLERLQAKWGEDCDLTMPGRGKNCEKPWKGDKYSTSSPNGEDEDEDEDDDDNASSTSEATRAMAREAITDAQKALSELQDEIEDAEDDDVDQDAIDTAKEALATAQAALKAAKTALTLNKYEVAVSKATAAEKTAVEATEDLEEMGEDEQIETDD